MIRFLFFRFITGPAELGDVPIPRTPPKMFVNTDSEQEELVLVVYKVRVIHFDVQYYATCTSLIPHCQKKKKETFSPQRPLICNSLLSASYLPRQRCGLGTSFTSNGKPHIIEASFPVLMALIEQAELYVGGLESNSQQLNGWCHIDRAQNDWGRGWYCCFPAIGQNASSDAIHST